jgi:hypothetical protein
VAARLYAMATVNRFAFLAVAMVFHLVYLYSIFDVYFVSPIVSGMQRFQIDTSHGTKAPADRLVLFVGMHVSTSAPIANNTYMRMVVLIELAYR